MKTPRDQRPLLVKKIKLRWWAITFLPLVALLYAGSRGWLPLPLLALTLFATIFFLISLSVALVLLLLRRQPKEPLQ